MATRQMEEGNDTLIQMFRAVEEGLAIAGTNTQSELGLSLDTAALELSLALANIGEVGLKWDLVGLDTTGKMKSESTHLYKLKLRRKAKPTRTSGPPAALEIAETIFSLAKATKSVVSRTTDFLVDEAVVTIDINQTKEGVIKVGGGGGKASGNLCRVTLTFKSTGVS
jgi:hypothetical protein